MRKVIVETAVTAAIGTWNCCEMGSVMDRNIVKANVSRAQRSHAAGYACHCSRGAPATMLHGHHEPMSTWNGLPRFDSPSNATLVGNTAVGADGK